MNKIQKEYMSAKQAREAFNKLFHKNGVYSCGFKKCVCKGIEGELKSDKVLLSSTIVSEERLKEFLDKQIVL